VFTITHNIDAVMRQLDDFGRRQVPFALSQALNDTANDAGQAVTRAIDRNIDRPTPFTRNAVYVRRSSKAMLASEIGLKPIQADYLRYAVTGGQRLPRRSAIVVPVGIRTNQYGNMPKSAVARILARSDTFLASSRNAKTRHLPPGIYQRPPGKSRRRSAPKLLVAFEPKADYNPILDFYRIVEVAVMTNFDGHLNRRLRGALLTAR
jgi:hypothetical protein